MVQCVIVIYSYYDSFKSNSISFDLLPELDDKYIDKLGIYAVGDRIRLEKALHALKPEVREDRLFQSKKKTEIELERKRSFATDHSTNDTSEIRSRSVTSQQSKHPYCDLWRNLICSSRNQLLSDYQFSTRTFHNDSLIDDDADYSYSYRSDGGLLLNPYDTSGTVRNFHTIGNYRSFDAAFSYVSI